MGTPKQDEKLPSLLLLPAPPEPVTAASLRAAYETALETALVQTKDADGAATLIVVVAGPFLSDVEGDGTAPAEQQQEEQQHKQQQQQQQEEAWEGTERARKKIKALVWPEAQSLLARLYTIIAVLCARHAIGTDVGGGAGVVDARVVLVDYDDKNRGPAGDAVAVLANSIRPNNTVVVDLPSFAAAFHPWQHIFYLQSEAGVHLRSAYLRYAKQVPRLQLHDNQLLPVGGDGSSSGGLGRALAGGLAGALAGVAGSLASGLASGRTSGTITPSRVMHLATRGRRTVCLGGTFDHLHPGHKLLLAAGVLLLDVPAPGTAPPCRYIIGITGDELLRNKKYAAFVQPWGVRARNVVAFLASLLALSLDGWAGKDEAIIRDAADADGGSRGDDADKLEATFRNGAISVQCVRIHDPFGPTIQMRDMDYLVVSGETRGGGRAVNDKRAAQGWPLLDVFEVDVLSAEEDKDDADEAGEKGQGTTKQTATSAAESFEAKISSTAIRKQKAEAAGARA